MGRTYTAGRAHAELASPLTFPQESVTLRIPMSDGCTIVTFQSSAFNTSQPKDYFINECCYGDDLARWLIAELRRSGIRTDTDPGQEDFGWYFGFRVGGTDYHLVLGYRPDEEDSDGVWIGWLERNLGFMRSLFGGRKRHIRPEAAGALHSVLSSSPNIRNVRWHLQRDFDCGNETSARPDPSAN